MLLVASLAETVAVVVSSSSTWGGKAPVARQGFRRVSPGFGGGKEKGEGALHKILVAL